MRVLIETNSNIGDAVMNVPVINFLISQYPDVSIDLVADARSADLFKDFNAIKNIYIKNKKSKKEKLKLFLQLRKTRYDLAIGLRSEGIPFLIRAKKKIYNFNKNKALLGKTSEAEYTFSCLKKIFPQSSFQDINQTISVSSSTLQEMKNLVDFHSEEKILAIAPGANSPGKIWPAENFIELINHISKRFDKVIIVGSSGESQVCRSIAEKTGAIDLSGQTSLRQTAALFSFCSLFIGNDSGLGHIAAAQGTPTLSIFAHTDIAFGNPVRYTPYRQHSVFRRSNDEAPISVEYVLAKLASLSF
jgi:ADP-heptose:LPS heptosyltransferase